MIRQGPGNRRAYSARFLKTTFTPWIWSLRPRSTEHGAPYVYSGDDINLAEKALELLTGKPVIALLYEQFQRPFAEPVSQFDLGTGTRFTAMYLAKVGQMILQDGA